MDALNNRVSIKPRLRHLFWLAYLIVALAVLTSSKIGNYVGISRQQALNILPWPLVIAILYELLAVGVNSRACSAHVLAVFKSAWANGTDIARRIFGGEEASTSRREARIAVGLTITFAVAFVVFLAKSLPWFTYLPDQHWAQATLDYGIDWKTPLFELGGNLLYGFGMQFPVAGQLLPMQAIAHLFPIQMRIEAAIVIHFLSAVILFWCIGTVIGLKFLYRIVFAAMSGLIANMPFGPDYLLWLVPPRFITYNFTAVLAIGETTILCLFTAFLFFLIGNRNSLTKNLCVGAGFGVGAFVPILAYPAASLYFAPILALYCGALLLTAESRREFLWKASVSMIVIAIMLVMRVPEFISSLYSFGFGAYFFEFSSEPPPSVSFNSIPALFMYFNADPRALLSFGIALAACVTAAFLAKGALSRFAIAVLVCEGAIIIITTINLWVWQVPLRGDYAELAHAPMLCGFLVLAIIVVAKLVDQRCVELGHVKTSKGSALIQYAIHGRKWVYASFFPLMIAFFWLAQEPPAAPSDYPPRQMPVTRLLSDELALSPGSPFRGRLMTIVPANLAGPSDPPAFYDAISDYRRYLGNDLWVDPLAYNIPMLNEFGHFSSPVTFAMARVFFGKEGDGFERATFVLSHFDLRMARLMGVRLVATDASALSDGTLLYEAKAGNRDVRIFRLDHVNLGQYSPTRLRLVRSASDAIAVMKSQDFDPSAEAVVESSISPELLPASSALVMVDRGPALVVRATSPAHSLLVLPFEYSRCLSMTITAGHAQLIPVNLQQTGLLFDGELEARIVYRFGLLQHSHCRSEDQQRADDLNLKEALLRYQRATIIRERPKLGATRHEPRD